MARFLALIFVLSILISCGQIGTISGGPKDEIAPKITSTNLSNQQLNFKDQVIEFTFDEYVVLNKPLEQIVLVPADSKIQSKLIQKTLSLTLEDTLEANTTYTLYLNAAVKDVSEGNDSLMKFTFSTGPKIDSLSFHVSVFDAFSGEKMSKVTVGLYPTFEDAQPRYFTQSQTDGTAKFEALRPGTYYVKAFIDKNQDLSIQPSEPQGYLWDPIDLNSDEQDTLLLPVSLPIQADKVKNARIIAPGIIALHVPENRSRMRIQLNDSNCDINQLIGRGEDSLLIAIGALKDIDLRLIIEEDTIQVRNTPKQQAAKIALNLVEKEGLQDHILLNCTDFIQWVDTSKINMWNGKDSSSIGFTVEYLANELSISPKKFAETIKLTISDGAITGLTGNKSVLFQKEIQIKQEREFGDLTMRLSEPIAAGIVLVLQKNQIIRQVPFTHTNRISIPNLLPGDYSFKLIIDENENGKWDPINPLWKTKAEDVLLFNTPTKIRANWEIETTFDVSTITKNNH
jgi:uncharacterized protein (DUF2141 family)